MTEELEISDGTALQLIAQDMAEVFLTSMETEVPMLETTEWGLVMDRFRAWLENWTPEQLFSLFHMSYLTAAEKLIRRDCKDGFCPHTIQAEMQMQAFHFNAVLPLSELQRRLAEEDGDV